MNFLTCIFVFATAIYMVRGACNTCSSLTNLACVGRSSFKVCNNGIPNPPAYPCPKGSVCTGGVRTCEPVDTPNIVIPCNNDLCGHCNEDLTFACSSYNTFRLCLNSGNPISQNYTCPEGTVCNREADNICVSLDAAIGSTCSWSTLTTTTQAPPTTVATTTSTTTVNPLISPQAYCAAKNLRGRFDLISDLTCKQYINCYQSGGVWYGSIYLCPSPNYFDPKKQMCVSAKPLRCAPETEEVCD